MKSGRLEIWSENMAVVERRQILKKEGREGVRPNKGVKKNLKLKSTGTSLLFVMSRVPLVLSPRYVSSMLSKRVENFTSTLRPPPTSFMIFEFTFPPLNWSKRSWEKYPALGGWKNTVTCSDSPTSR